MSIKALSILWFSLFLFQLQSLAQQNIATDTASLNQKGRAILKKVNQAETYKEEVKILKEALNYFLQSRNWDVTLDIKAKLAELNYILLRYEEFEKETKEIKKLLRLHTISDSIHNQVQKILVWHSDMIEDYSTSEVLYKAIFEYDLLHSSKGTAALTASNIGYFYEKSISDFQRATDYYQKSIKLIEESPIKYESYRAIFYSNLGNCLKEQKQYIPAKAAFYKSLQILKSEKEKDMDITTKWWNYQNLSAIYLENNVLDSCLHYCNKALTVLEKDKKSYWDDYQTYQTKGKYCIKTKDYPSALSYFKKGVNRAKRQEDIFRPIDAIVELANFLSDRGNHKEALDSLQMGIQLLCPDFKNQDILSTTLPQSFAHKKAALKIIEKKATILYNQYKINKDPSYLKASLVNYNLAVDITNRIRQDFTGDNSKYFLAKNVLSFYESAIEVAHTLYELEHDPKHLEKAFFFAEQNKSVLLTESIKENTAKGFGNLPDSVLQKEQAMKLDIVQLEKKLYNAKKLSPVDAEQVKVLSDDLFTLKEGYDHLISRIEKEYPKYFELKHQPSIASIEQLQEDYLDQQTSLLEYFVGEENIFLFCIQRNAAKLFKIKKPEDLLASFNQLRSLITTAPNSVSYASDLKNFNALSKSFHDLLLEPASAEFKASEHLIIIPDDLLIYLPFETLITEQKQANSFSPKVQFYLLEEHAIRYSFSASLLLNTKDLFYKKQKDFVGFAPNFKNPLLQASRNCGDGDLYSLQCSEQEVTSIHNLFEGEVLSQNLASKSNFESRVRDFNIIHLATHACVDESDPNFSRIYFADDFLSNYDLTNMRIEANLAVLSACNTNVGPLMKGDGIPSISKGFIMAGCPSILTSLWSVDDCSTSELMIQFYQSLKQGKAKSEALREAKLAYLEQADKEGAHPYYWAPFMLSGQDVALAGSSGNRLWVFGVLFLGLVALLFFYRKGIR